MHRVPPPRPGDYNPLFEAEISLVPEVPDFSVRLRRQGEETRELLARFGERHGDLRYGSGKWTVREVAGHLVDTERVLTCRALRIARGDQAVLSGFDTEAYVAAGGFASRTLDSLIGELLAVRAATVALFEALPAEAFPRRGQVGKNPITVAAILYLLAGHELHHQELLCARYLPALEPAPRAPRPPPV